MKSGAQNFLNKKFFGKKSLKPTGKAMVKEQVEKKLATEKND